MNKIFQQGFRFFELYMVVACRIQTYKPPHNLHSVLSGLRPVPLSHPTVSIKHTLFIHTGVANTMEPIVTRMTQAMVLGGELSSSRHCLTLASLSMDRGAL